MARPQALLILTPEGKAGGFISTSGDPPGSAEMFTPAAADRVGRFYAIDRTGEAPPARVVPGQGGGAAPDSQVIARIDRRTWQRERLGKVSRRAFIPGPTAPRSGPGPAPPFSTVDQWAVHPDGRVAVVSVSPYRVTFIATNGRHTTGPVLPVERVRVTTAHREAWLELLRQPGPAIMSTRGGGVTYGMMRPPFPPPEVWPDYLPPFLAEAVSFAPDGLLWVHRTAAADAPPTYDLIDESGRIAARLTLPQRSRLVGFGARSVYLVRLDEDDLEYLQRYPLPAR
jgi:hypothetical protein